MKKYVVVSKEQISELEAEVTAFLTQGWQLTGGISVAYKHEHSEGKHIHGHLVYAQAVTKEE